MPYIAFELDAMERAPEVARAIGLSVGDTAWGLLQMWRWCWREKTDLVSAVHLQGFFGSPAGVALEAFGFVAPAGAYFRVRGAARYLKISEAKSKGGKAASGNLKRGKVPGNGIKSAGGSAGGSAGTSAGNQPGEVPGSRPALTATSDERLTTNESKQLAGKPAKGPNEHQEVIDSLVAIFESQRGPYGFNKRDALAVKNLRAKHSRPEIEIRWRRAMALTHPTIDNIFQLDGPAWNRCARDDPSKPKAFDFDQGIISSRRAESPPPQIPSVYVPPEEEIPFDHL